MDCCKKEKKNKGFLSGILYGLTAHSFCILFIIFTVIGATTLTTAIRPLLISAYFFHILVLVSIVFATASALLYLKKGNNLSLSGIRGKRNYLFTLYGTTIVINLLFFVFIFPIAANVSGGASLTEAVTGSFGEERDTVLSEGEDLLTVEVDIPCPGHAYLVFTDLDDFSGVEDINFRFPNIFDISYNPELVSTGEILSVDVFQNYKTLIK